MKTVLLIGLGRFGRHLAMQLNELGHQVMAVDKDEERVNECMPFVTNAQIGDSTRVDFLRSLGVGNYDVCYVTISGDFQNSLETTSLLKELGAKYVVSRAERDVQAKFLLRNGADAVTYPEKQLAKWAAIRYTANHIFDYIELDEKHAIIEVAVPDSWQGHSIGELDIRRKYGVNILGVKRDGKTDVTISPETVLDSSLTLLVLGGMLFCASLVRSAAHAAHYTVWRTESHLGSRGGFVRRYEMRLALEHLSYADLRRSPATRALGCCPVFVTAGSCRP